MTYFGNKKLDMKSVRVETEDNYYDFTCGEEFIGVYDNDLKAWFAYELFDMDDETSWLHEWLAAKSVTATLTGKDGSTTVSYTHLIGPTHGHCQQLLHQQRAGQQQQFLLCEQRCV